MVLKNKKSVSNPSLKKEGKITKELEKTTKPKKFKAVLDKDTPKEVTPKEDVLPKIDRKIYEPLFKSFL